MSVIQVEDNFHEAIKQFFKFVNGQQPIDYNLLTNTNCQFHLAMNPLS